ELVRPGLLRPCEEPRGARKVLVLGGSKGARAINVAMVEAAPYLARATPRLALTHQTGERDLRLVQEGYRAAGLDVRVEPFIQQMDEEMTSANVIVSRAGSTTLAEIAASGRAVVLIPLPTATDDHQRKNAQALAAAGAADVLDQRELTGERLAGCILGLLDDDARREAMARAVRAFARPDAAKVIVDRAL